MIRVVIVLSSTFTGTLLGLLIGYLNMQSLIETTSPSQSDRVESDLFVLSYLVAPLLGTLLGFLLALITIKMFWPSKE